MPRFLPIARIRQLPSTLDALGAPKPYEIPRKVCEANPRRRALYVENLGGDADPLRLCSDLTPKRGNGDDTLPLESDSFAAFQNLNPLVLPYAGLVAGLMDAIPSRSDEGYHVAELVDDVDAPATPTMLFQTASYGTAQLVAQAGPIYQPVKIYEASPSMRLLRIVATLGQVVVTTLGAPISINQGFRLPLFVPLYFRAPYVPRRSLFAFDASGGGARLVVTQGHV